jgi:hypothetical protein
LDTLNAEPTDKQKVEDVYINSIDLYILENIKNNQKLTKFESFNLNVTIILDQKMKN